MTLILKFDKDMVKMSQHMKKGTFYVKGFKSYSLNRQTDRQHGNITFPQIQVVKNQNRSININMSYNKMMVVE